MGEARSEELVPVRSEYSTYRFFLGCFRIERGLRTKAGLCWQHYEHAPGACTPNSSW